MRLYLHDPLTSSSLREELERRGLVYGNGDRYVSLISPSSAILSRAEAQGLAADLNSLAGLYRAANDIYLEALEGQAPKWVSRFVEQGLSDRQRHVHRLVARAGMEPGMGRADYVEVEGGRRQIAEVQWKSGGPGLMMGHQDAFVAVIPPRPGIERLGDLERSYLDSLEALSPSGDPVVLNEVRAEWLVGEDHLAAQARKRDWVYRVTDRSQLAQSVVWRDGGLRLGNRSGERVTVLRGRGFTEQLDDTVVECLAAAALDGSIWIEAPLNFLYRQKWCLALPFMKEFAARFSDHARSILIAGGLVIDGSVDLAPVAASLPAEIVDRVTSIRLLREVVELPESIRRRLILKCGAGTGDLHSGGRGVFRLNGSRSWAQKVVDTVLARGKATGEPWVVQPFVDAKQRVPMAMPEQPERLESEMAHYRLMAFGGRQGEGWRLHGGIANFARHWKVNGARGYLGQSGEMLGSAMVDVRLDIRTPRLSGREPVESENGGSSWSLTPR